jgi:hypothetical protein
MSEKTKMMWLAGLIVVAAVVWYFNSKAPSTVSNASGDPEAAYHPLAVENPELQRAKLEASRKTEYKSAGRDLFSEVAPPTEAEKKQEEKQARRQVVGPIQPPPPPPPALPANVKFFGYGTVPNGSARRAFLTDGDQIFIVAEGDTLLGKYRVVKIGNANLDFEEVATGRRGSTTLSEEPAPPAPAS